MVKPASYQQHGARPPATPIKNFFVNLGSYLETNRADQVFRSVKDAGLQLPLYREAAQVEGRNYMRVRSGPFQNREDAVRASQQIAYTTGIQTRIETY